ncbi:MAG: UDP-N-acetylmuramate dehydrogenase [Phycisphaeraceae bacterium]|nr:UDP-N-acetylmuramate dehydrogenase [Phycisphaeraceae bacterium]
MASTIENQESGIETFLEGLNIPFQRNVPLAPWTWYRVGGPARVLAQPSSVEQLAAIAARANEAGVPTYVLGGGANLLVSDAGVDGLVIQLSDPAFKQVKIEGNIATLGAGCDLFKVIPEISKAGLGGLEVLAGIPGTIGGAVRMNAGGIYGDIGKTIRRVKVMDSTGHVYHRDRDDLIFSYRKSNIAARYIIEVEFELIPDDPNALVRRFKEIFLYKKNSQPMGDNSAGCAFKNPTPVEGGEKLSAGKLIDQAGLKGFRIGGAEISSQHANFVIAHPGATAADLLAVMEHAQKRVLEVHGIRLEREVVVWP